MSRAQKKVELPVSAIFATPPIVLTPRIDLREALRSELKAMGWREIKFPDSVEKCIEQVFASPEPLLVLDWELGAKSVIQILSAAKGRFNVDTRPIFLLIPEVNPNIVAAAAEYGVSQLHAGPVSRLAIRESVDSLIKEDDATREIRDALLKVANCREKNDATMATKLLQDLHAANIGNERIAMEYAENLIQVDRWDEAECLLEPLVALTPPRVRALHLMGRCRMKQGHPQDAIALLMKAKIINPHNVDRLIDLGNAFLHDDKVEEALQSFEEARQLDPENKAAKIGRSQCMLLTGEVNEALALLKSISGPREMASIFNTAAVLSMHAGKFDKGMALYRSALSAIGKDQYLAARLMFNMGLGYRRWSKPDKAAQCFERALGFDPGFVKAKRQKQIALKLARGGGSSTAAGGASSDGAALGGGIPRGAGPGFTRPKPSAATSAFDDEEFTAIRGEDEDGSLKRAAVPPLSSKDESDITPMEWDPES